MSLDLVTWIGIAGFVVLVVGAAVLILYLLVRGKKKEIDPEAGLDENLRHYPPAPDAGAARLKLGGQQVRLRLVVLAPAGNVELDVDMADRVLESALPGLADVAKYDKPRVKLWPPQLSHAGFIPKFFRRTHRPE